LTPIFFILYLNALLSELRALGCCPFSFADDCNALVAASTAEEIQATAQNFINTSGHYLEESKLALSADKTNYLQFKTPRSVDIELSIEYNGVALMETIKRRHFCHIRRNAIMESSCGHPES